MCWINLSVTLNKKQFSGILWLLFIFNFSSCLDKEERPENLISEEKMILLLADLHTAEAYVKNTNIGFYTVDSLQVVFYKLQEHVLQEHQIDSATFYKSYEFYLRKDLKTLDLIYQAVVDTLQIRADNAPEVAIEFDDEGENKSLLAQIKDLEDYQEDEIHFLPNGRLYSRNPLIQSHIQQIYDIPQNMQIVKSDAKTQDIPEAVIIYKKAIELYSNEYGKRTKQIEPVIKEMDTLLLEEQSLNFDIPIDSSVR